MNVIALHPCRTHSSFFLSHFHLNHLKVATEDTGEHAGAELRHNISVANAKNVSKLQEVYMDYILK